MTRIPLTIATEAYDRILALRDGRVQVEGCEINYLIARNEQLFLRGFGGSEYDVCELSMSTYLLSVARGENDYIALPVFPSRLFRHSAIYVNAKAGIEAPGQLTGKRMGVPEYQMTAALWARGLLDDQYGVPPSAMQWVRGGLHDPGRVEKLPLSLPPEIRIDELAAGETLNQMLAEGRIDALISPRAPQAFLNGDARVKRLFPDYRHAEQEYYKGTGIFPIMHVLAVRRALVADHPWLPNALFDAFEKAKDTAVSDFSDVSALRVTLPWFAAELDETRALMGKDYWPYGIDANRATLELMLEFAHRHGTTPRRLGLDEIFAPATIIQQKI